MALGRVDVDRLLEEMTSEQFAEWQAYYTLEPWGEERGDMRAAIVAEVVAQAHSSKRRRFDPMRWVPRYDKPKVRYQSEEDMKSIFRRACKAFNRITGHDA